MKTILILVVSLLILSTSSRAEQKNKDAEPKRYSLSLGTEPYPVQERIVGLAITVSGGMFASMPNIPAGWSISIDNTNGECKATGGAFVGAAALNQNEFERLFQICEIPGGHNKPTINVVLDTTRDFEASTKREIKGAKLSLAVEAAGKATTDGK